MYSALHSLIAGVTSDEPDPLRGIWIGLRMTGSGHELESHWWAPCKLLKAQCICVFVYLFICEQSWSGGNDSDVPNICRANADLAYADRGVICVRINGWLGTTILLSAVKPQAYLSQRPRLSRSKSRLSSHEQALQYPPALTSAVYFLR